MLRSKWVAGLAVVGLVGSLGVSTAGVAQATAVEPVMVTQDLLNQEPGVAVDLSGPLTGAYGASNWSDQVRFLQSFVAESSGVVSVRVDLSILQGLNNGDALGTFALYPDAPLGTFDPEFLATSEPLATTPALLESDAAVGRFDFVAVAGQTYVLIFATADLSQGGTVPVSFNVSQTGPSNNASHRRGLNLTSSWFNSGYASRGWSPSTDSHPSIKVTTSPIATLESSNRELVDVDGTRWVATAGGGTNLVITPNCGELLTACEPWGFDLTGLSGPQEFAPSITPELPTIIGTDGVKFRWTLNVSVDPTPPSFSMESYERLKDSIVVDFTCLDEESGVAPNPVCGKPVSFPRGDVERDETILVKDRAGNGSVSSVTIPALRSSAPVITVTGVQNGKTYPHGTTLKPTCQATSTLVWDLRATSTDSESSSVPCKGVTSSVKNSNGSVSWKYVATATDSDVDGGTASTTVRWTVAAKPVVVKPPVAKPVLSISGFGTQNFQGVPKVKLGKAYSNTLRLTVNGKTVVTKGAPTWLNSVASNASGSAGKPTAKGRAFAKTDTPGVWTKSTTFNSTGFRKFGIQYPNGVVVYRVVYVVR